MKSFEDGRCASKQSSSTWWSSAASMYATRGIFRQAAANNIHQSSRPHLFPLTYPTGLQHRLRTVIMQVAIPLVLCSHPQAYSYVSVCAQYPECLFSNRSGVRMKQRWKTSRLYRTRACWWPNPASSTITVVHGSLVVNPREFFTIDRILHVRYSSPSHLLIQVLRLLIPLYQLGCWLLYGGLVQL